MQSWQYIALLGAVIVIAALLMPKNKGQKQNASSDARMEQLELAFEQFMENMEREHQDLVQMLTRALQKLREEDRLKSDQIARLEARQLQLEEQLAKLAQQNAGLVAKLQISSDIIAAAEKVAKATPDIHSPIAHSSSLQSQSDLSSESNVEAKDTVENGIHQRYAELFELHRAGKSVETIAKKLGKNKGEVQLILQLAMQEENANNA